MATKSKKSNPGNESVLQRFILLAITYKATKEINLY